LIVLECNMVMTADAAVDGGQGGGNSFRGGGERPPMGPAQAREGVKGQKAGGAHQPGVVSGVGQAQVSGGPARSWARARGDEALTQRPLKNFVLLYVFSFARPF